MSSQVSKAYIPRNLNECAGEIFVHLKEIDLRIQKKIKENRFGQRLEISYTPLQCLSRVQKVKIAAVESTTSQKVVVLASLVYFFVGTWYAALFAASSVGQGKSAIYDLVTFNWYAAVYELLYSSCYAAASRGLYDTATFARNQGYQKAVEAKLRFQRRRIVQGKQNYRIQLTKNGQVLQIFNRRNRLETEVRRSWYASRFEYFQNQWKREMRQTDRLQLVAVLSGLSLTDAKEVWDSPDLD